MSTIEQQVGRERMHTGGVGGGGGGIDRHTIFYFGVSLWRCNNCCLCFMCPAGFNVNQSLNPRLALEQICGRGPRLLMGLSGVVTL